MGWLRARKNGKSLAVRLFWIREVHSGLAVTRRREQLAQHVVLLLLCLPSFALVELCTSRLAGALLREPDGFGRATFGMAEEEVKAIYPDLTRQPLPQGTEPSMVAPTPEFSLNRYKLVDQTVGPLERCKVEFLFFNHVFYQAIVTCPDKGQVESYLESQFGAPTIQKPPIKYWTGATGSVSYTSVSGVFLVENLSLSKAINMTMLHHALGSGHLGSASTATPGAGTQTQEADH